MIRNPYKTREGGATVTIFVPYDCKNNCPFCINKEEYASLEPDTLILDPSTPCPDGILKKTLLLLM